MSSKRLLFPIAAVALAGCNTINPVSQSVDPAFGEASKYNAALQIIDPNPVYTELDEQPGYHGEKAAAAVERYRTDQVKELERMTTTRRAGAGGGGGSGSGSGSGGGPQ